MDLSNIFAAPELRGLARVSSKPNRHETVANTEIQSRQDAGWTLERQGQRTSRMSLPKALPDAFPDRVWTVLYRMGFAHMSGAGGSILTVRSNTGEVSNQLDAVAVDNDVAIYVECRTAAQPHRVPKFAEDVAHLSGLRVPFQRAIKAQFEARKIAAVYWSQNLILSDNDEERARQHSVRLFNEPELRYYEELTRQLGVAARFQFLADVFGSTKIDTLSIKVPAVSVRIGPTRCFTFALSPERLLKLAYVSHRAKGGATDVDTYQRLLKRNRIMDIREYVNNGGYFPTNIVLNIRSRRALQFDKAKTPEGVDAKSGSVGWLTLPSEYKSAWIIDGQHRLFAYANTPIAKSAELSILAFENLSESDQARLFVDINAKQKSVKQNLLVELWAELHWNSENQDDRIRAIIAKLALTLDSDPLSPFYQRVVRADDTTTPTRSISLQTLSASLFQPEFFMAESKAGPIPGAFWSKDQMGTLRRASDVLNAWIRKSVSTVLENWNLGKAPGGALGMNDSVASLFATLRSVFRHLSDRGVKLYDLTTEELIDAITPFAAALAGAFSLYTSQDFEFYRSLRGGQGQTQRMRELQLVIHKTVPEFDPEGLAEYLQSRDKNAMAEARELLDDIEILLHNHVLNTLKAAFGEKDQLWWYDGVPKNVRARILQEINEEGRDSPKESRFTLIDYRTIAMDKWNLFKDTLGQERSSASKDKRTGWMARVNDIRKFAAHPTKGVAKMEDVQYLREQTAWLKAQLSEDRAPNEGATETSPSTEPAS